VDAKQKQAAEAIVNVFETGAIAGKYGSVTLLPGDKGHLTYGRSQTTLASGNLYLLLNAYCGAAEAQFAADLRLYLLRLRSIDLALDTDANLRSILREAGDDPVMRTEQDAFFDRAYFAPAMKAAAEASLASALGQAVVYDSFIQGGWKRVCDLVEQKTAGAKLTEPFWVRAYVDARRTWLLSLDDPLPRTVYRMDGFRDLIDQNKWNLDLPFTIRGVELTASNISADARTPTVRASIVDSTTRPILTLTQPYTRGPAVKALQAALARCGFANSADGVFGPFTEVLVKQFQRSRNLKPDGTVGPLSWAELEAS